MSHGLSDLNKAHGLWILILFNCNKRGKDNGNAIFKAEMTELQKHQLPVSQIEFAADPACNRGYPQ